MVFWLLLFISNIPKSIFYNLIENKYIKKKNKRIIAIFGTILKKNFGDFYTSALYALRRNVHRLLRCFRYNMVKNREINIANKRITAIFGKF